MSKHPLLNPNSTHYQLWSGVESIELIESYLTVDELIGACKFNILKYRLRIGKKDDLEKDMTKIKTYEDYLAYLQAKQGHA